MHEQFCVARTPPYCEHLTKMSRRRAPLFVTHAITVFLGLYGLRQTNWNAKKEQVPPTLDTPPAIVLDHPDVIARRRNITVFPPPRDHPFAGARDANGHWGYVADPYAVRQHMLLKFRRETGNARATFEDMLKARYMPLEDNGDVNETEQVCQTLPRKGIEGDGWDVLVEKVVVGGPLPLPESPEDPREPPDGWWHGTPPARNAPPYFNSPNPPKIFCGMYTYHKKQYLLEAAVQSWAWRCDGFVAFSDVTNPSIGAVDLPHYGEEHYSNMWQKHR
eukprot:CCRYP_020307-RA/>CCRYP_020307-RA protein AED:0.03 eAED:0.03 QI:56/1/1/1/0/0/2/883/275